MSNYEKLYWFTRIDNLNGLIVFGIVITAVYSIIAFGWGLVHEDFDEFYRDEKLDKRMKLREFYISKIKICLTVFFVLTVIQVFIPTQKEVIIIMAGGKTIDYVESDTSLAKLPYQTTKFISTYLEKQIKETGKSSTN